MIQIDFWGGDLHQNLVSSETVATWAEVLPIIENACEAGMLVNVLMLDFKAPAHRAGEEARELGKYLYGASHE